MPVASIETHVQPTIAQLLASARAGCPEAFGHLLSALRPWLWLLAEQNIAANLRTKVGVSDLVQETYSQAVAQFPQFRGSSEEEFRAWVRLILSHQAINQAKRYCSAEKRELARECSEGNGRLVEGAIDSLPAAAETPSREALRREEQEAMTRALALLAPDDRQVIELRHLAQRSYAEIAQIMGRSETAVRRLWSRAMTRWKAAVSRTYDRP